jgi:hypothetical protein
MSRTPLLKGGGSIALPGLLGVVAAVPPSVELDVADAA